MNPKLLFVVSSHAGVYLVFNLLAYGLKIGLETQPKYAVWFVMSGIIILGIFSLVAYGVKYQYLPTDVLYEKLEKYTESWIYSGIIGFVLGWIF
jgi:hypothetical protein